MPIIPDSFCRIEKVKKGLNKLGDWKLPIWINLENDKFKVEDLYFPTLYAASKFKKTHRVMNGHILEIEN